jgi:CarD family transcriptional regulator, regulator of rRNA transcription
MRLRSYPRSVKLAVGDAVVYAAHGAGRVAAREQRTVLGVEHEVVVLELGHGLWVTLPIEQARERLRPVASEAEVQRVQQTLHEEGEPAEDSWHQRLKQGRAKLASGGPLELAELVRDGMRHQSQARKGAAPKLSETERRLYLQARELLTREIGSARGLELVEADAWIEEQATPA